MEGPGCLGAQAKSWSVIKIWVVLEGSRGLARDEDRSFYWIETLENYLHTGPKSGWGGEYSRSASILHVGAGNGSAVKERLFLFQTLNCVPVYIQSYYWIVCI